MCSKSLKDAPAPGRSCMLQGMRMGCPRCAPPPHSPGGRHARLRWWHAHHVWGWHGHAVAAGRRGRRRAGIHGRARQRHHRHILHAWLLGRRLVVVLACEHARTSPGMVWQQGRASGEAKGRGPQLLVFMACDMWDTSSPVHAWVHAGVCATLHGLLKCITSCACARVCMCASAYI